ncbi:MAG: peptide chain release factor N(5)-glutamine methyltransferase [Flavobacteriia bacterium]|nr:peptide chain release factor N(5)-glutamine methyltransferase [Flavobacteriia bacterium]
MFLSSNSFQAIKNYFHNSLENIYSLREIEYFLKEIVIHRLQIDKTNYLLEKTTLLFSESDILYFHEILHRLKDKEPFQYIIGKCYFLDLELNIDSRALIPRPETEELVKWVVDKQKESAQILSILDLGTGSACIALSLKYLLPNSLVSAIDINKNTLNLAKENAEKLGLNITFLEQDVLSSTYPFQENSFDVWISNPPYIPMNEKHLLDTTVVNFEPEIALFVPDNNPLKFYEHIGLLAKKYLKHEGQLFFEVHENFALDCKNLLENLLFDSIELKKDLQGKYRMLCAIVNKNPTIL